MSKLKSNYLTCSVAKMFARNIENRLRRQLENALLVEDKSYGQDHTKRWNLIRKLHGFRLSTEYAELIYGKFWKKVKHNKT